MLDTTGGAVPGAKVEIVETETNVTYETQTNGQGQYTVPNIPRGTYKITANKEGFTTVIQQPIVVDAETERRVDFAIQPGAVQQTISVVGEAPVLDVSTTGNSTGITDNYVHELPLTMNTEKRVITQYLLMVPGLVGGINNGMNDTSWTASVNGQVSGQTETFVDGARATEEGIQHGAFEETGPTVEAVGEVTVVANAFNAEYGGFGAWFTQVSIKSGTNQLHGSVYDHLQNSDMNARTFFQPVITPLRQNEGGGTLGGPVVIPKVYSGKNKTFFFVNQGAFLANQGASGALVTYPTAAFKVGDFSQLVNSAGSQIPIYDPLTTTTTGTTSTRTQFPGNIIPQNRISPQAQAILPMIPNAPLPGDVNNAYQAAPANQYDFFDIYNTTIKLDQAFSDRNKVSITYDYGNRYRNIEQYGYATTAPIEYHLLQRVTTHSARVNHDYVIAPTLLNHLTIAYDRYKNLGPDSSQHGNWDQTLGIAGIPDNASGAFPAISFSGGTATPLQMGRAYNERWGEQHFTFNDTLTWIKGKHEFKFGAFYGTDDQNENQKGGDQGSFAFSNAQTSIPLNTVDGSAFASFLLGAVSSTSALFPTTAGMRTRRYAAFAEDSWRITQSLTLSYGLRYDYVPPQYEINNHLTSFEPNLSNPAAGGIPGALAYATGSSGFNRTFVQPWRKGWAPRLGLAYQIDKKTVLRASGGIYYAQPLESGSSTAGFNLTATFASPDGINPAYYWNTPWPTNYLTPPQTSNPSFLNGQSATWLNPQADRMPQTVSWTIGIQREVVHNLSVDVAYIGSKSTHLSYNGNENVVPLQDLALGTLLAQNVGSAAANSAGILSPFPSYLNQSTHTVAQALRPYPQYTAVTFATAVNPSGNSNFNSLQIKLTQRLSHGLTIQSFFEWEKWEQDLPVNPNANRFTGTTLSTTDIPDTLQLSANYQLPFGPGRHFLNSRSLFPNYVLGGWGLTASLRYESGFPLTIGGGGQLGSLGYTQEANYIGGDPYGTTDPRDFNPSTSRYLNAAAFAIPSPYAFGNLAPTLGWLRGPTQKYEAVSIAKTFAIKERARFELGADAINPFNFVRWGSPNTTLSSSTFGMITSTQGVARTMQINAKLSF